MIRVRKIFSIIAAILGLIIIALAFDIQQSLQQKFELSEPVLYNLEKGSSVQKLARDLHALKLLEKPIYLILYARIMGQAQSIQAGEYRLTADMNTNDLLNNMVAGNVSEYTITVIEGWTFKQLLQALRQQTFIKQTINATDSNDVIMERIGFPEVHPEGRFYPSTYSVTKGTTDIEFLKRAYAKMESILNKEWNNRTENLPLRSAYEALILASIIEKETGVPDERQLIASVFVNRLRKNMRLQTDPTVIYGIGESYDGDIRFRDLKTDTPYNTYTRGGLPPTPIALPGRDAIYAALHPVESNMIYFVAIGNGRHFFSATLAEHEAAVDQYQRHLRRKSKPSPDTGAEK